MNIVVTVKQVADPNIPPSHIQLDADAKRIISPFGIPPVMNGYDANALEEALRLREASGSTGGKITAITLGEENSRDVLKRAVAMGANTAVLLSDPEWLHADSASVGQLIAAGIKKSGPFDLVLCGRQASDTDGGQVLHWIAHYLDIPIITPVTKIESVEGDTLTVQRLTDDGVQRLKVKLPVLLGVSSEMNEPRLPSMRGLMGAGRAMIAAWKKADIAVQLPAPRVELRKLAIQLREGKAEMIAGKTGAEQGAALADKLREKGLI
jgi:electron transfer flavoprotein beta subunit